MALQRRQRPEPGDGEVMSALTAIGLMSGTSMDGVDAAILRTDGERLVEAGPALTLPYPSAFRDRLRAIMGRRANDKGVEQVSAELTDFHIEAVNSLIEENRISISNIDIIGFHGQTILHRPGDRLTVQIGDGGRLAKALGISVAYDFRSADVAAGGQGAPLVPLFHAALASRLDLPVAMLNIGGVANVTWIGGENEILAFDTGPGNAPIDDWVSKAAGLAQDEDGHLARSGKVDRPRIEQALSDSYFARKPPKSLDRYGFTASLVDGLSAADGAATLTEFTAESIAAASRHFPAPAKTWIVCGGGRHNSWLMARLAARIAPGKIIQCDTLGWDGNMLEAQAFAYLAVRVLRGLPLSLPSTTGVPRPMPGGKIAQP